MRRNIPPKAYSHKKLSLAHQQRNLVVWQPFEKDQKFDVDADIQRKINAMRDIYMDIDYDEIDEVILSLFIYLVLNPKMYN
jgi:hypothetical protein